MDPYPYSPFSATVIHQMYTKDCQAPDDISLVVFWYSSV